MQVEIKPSRLAGTMSVPSSKSMMQRVCATALLHNGTCIVNNIGNSADDTIAISVIQQLGAEVSYLSTSDIKIVSNGVVDFKGNVNCGESGLSSRLFTIIAALSPNKIVISGMGSLGNRSMSPFSELFKQLDVSTLNFNGKLPITIKGPLTTNSISIDGSLSSQFLSGLLIAYAFNASEQVSIEVRNLVSKPYIDMTLDVLEDFGKTIINNSYEEFVISPSVQQQSRNIEIDIEGDWSSASFWLVAGALKGSIMLKGLNLYSKQADKAILSVLKDTGADISIDDSSVSVRSDNSKLKSFIFDATNCPDLFPILSIYASLCNGESQIKGLHRLKEKESDRSVTVKKMLEGFGVQFAEKNDILYITGQDILEAATIDSSNDHRIAMAASIGSLNANGVCIINNANAVKKSYNNFYTDLRLLGGNYASDVDYCK